MEIATMNYTQGQQVSVKNQRGERVVRRVWSDEGARVFVTSDEVFGLLKQGLTDLFPVGVPKDDVEAATSEN